jgi:hypothetical protein
MTPHAHPAERIAPAHAALRCQHIHMSGKQCGSPAMRGEALCYFHKRLHSPGLDFEPYLPLIEDASSLQLALARVMRGLQVGHVEYKRTALMLYALQIACANLKNFQAEHPEPELAEDHQSEFEPAVNPAKEVAGKRGDELTLVKPITA